MKKTGAILKKAREEKGLSLHEIGLSLKINSKILRAIEEGDEENLPAKTFLRGFVQSYSNYLHIDTQMVLISFYEEMGSTTPQPFIRESEKKEEAAQEASTPSSTESTVMPEAKAEAPARLEDSKPDADVISMKPEPTSTSTSTQKVEPLRALSDNRFKKSLGWLALAIILVVSIGFTKRMIDKYSKEAEVPSAEVAQTMEGATPVISEATDVEDAVEDILEDPDTNPSPTQNTTEPDSTASIAADKLTTPSTPTKTTQEIPVKTEEAKNEDVKVVKEKVEKKEEVKNEPPKEEAKAPVDNKKDEVTQKPVELIVEALDAVEIEYASASGKMQKIKLTSEQVHTFKSKSGLKINFSNGGAVNLILNGNDIGIPGDLGKPIKLAY